MARTAPVPGSARGAQRREGERYLNREVSVLDYQARVLARAADGTLPLLDRVFFVWIFSRNLDDFFQVRVAGLKEQVEAAPGAHSPDGLTPADQLVQIRAEVDGLCEGMYRLWSDELQPALAAEGVEVVRVGALERSDLDHLAAYYRDFVFPVLTPLAVDPGHPFPHISHLSLSLAVIVRDPLRRDQRFARIKIPPLLPRFVTLPGGRRFVPIEDVIASQVQTLFPGMEIVSRAPFRVTRDNDLDVEDSEAEDLLATIQTELLRHRRRARAVRLEVTPEMSPAVRELLVRELELGAADVYTFDGMLDLGGLDFLTDLDRPELKQQPWTPVTPARLEGIGSGPRSFFDVLKEGDLLVHHPYESFSTSVQALIEEAAADPQVLAIKQTLYRTSGPTSPIALSLARAAEAGKQVVALVELKARGDEQANIEWAQRLEEAGVHVVYGLVGLKTHSKVMLIVRQEGAGVRRYVHIATGNYNPRTANSYEDIGLLSADPELGADAGELFNFLTGYSRQRRYRRLLVAPSGMRSGITRLITREAEHPDGRIVLKVNNLVDVGIIDALYEASAAGAEIDLLVRGICCLRPGVPGLSERIRVRSIVGRFLEHSRIFCFGSEQRGFDYYVGSADMMDRNLDRRVEALVPVSAEPLKRRLAEIIDNLLLDDTLAWTLGPDGGWTKVPTGAGHDAQRAFAAMAQERSREADAALA